ncbi:hypothetical protein PENSPDRAFT_658201 [Peniophora sp. CONT]|nr:hypothetical protein PENSPDRAFT_658201 [Peniophora sp. CONT]
MNTRATLEMYAKLRLASDLHCAVTPSPAHSSECQDRITALSEWLDPVSNRSVPSITSITMSHLNRHNGPPMRVGQATQQHRIDDYSAPIMRNPVAAVEKLRKLHDGSPAGERNEELSRWADRLNVALWQCDDLVEEDGWRKFIGADVTNICLDIITRAGFWQRDAILRYALLDSTSTIVQYATRCNDPDTTSVLLSRATALWRSVWENRSRGSFSSLRTQQDIAANSPEEIVRLLSAYGSLYYTHHCKDPPPDTYMPHVGLHAWMVYGDSSPVNVIALSVSCLLTLGHKCTNDLYREVIMSPSGVSAEAAVLRINREFARIKVPGTLITFTSIYMSIVHFPDILPAIGRHSLVREASAAMNRIHHGPGTVQEKTSCFSVVMAFLDSYASSARDQLASASLPPQSVGLRGEDVLDIFANGVGLLAEKGGTGFNDTDALLCVTLSRFMNDWSRFYVERQALEEAQERRPRHERVFRESMRSRARAVWWPSLRGAQNTKYLNGHKNIPQMARLTDTWASFGRALGLDASKEQARHEKATLGRCAWRDCQYHKKAADTVLLSCKGCGEVRYCGRVCQKHDWSKGGHKARCGRRLK